MMVIGSIVKELVLDEVVDSLISKELRKKYFKSTNEALIFHGILKEKGKKREKGKYKSRVRHKSLGKHKEKCWIYGKVRHCIRD
jgi:hypothetical protein